MDREGFFVNVDYPNRQVGVVGGRIQSLIMIKCDEAQGLDEEWIRITEQNRPRNKRDHKGDVDEVRVAPCHRGPR